jgi:hypothetical protein
MSGPCDEPAQHFFARPISNGMYYVARCEKHSRYYVRKTPVVYYEEVTAEDFLVYLVLSA